MDYNSLIHEFLEGGLSKTREDELFAQFSSNEELRGELRNSINIDNALGKKLSSFAPSAKATIDLFSKAGFGAPGFASEEAPQKTSFFKKYSQGLKAGFFTGLTAIIIVLLLWPEGNIGELNALRDNNAALEKDKADLIAKVSVLEKETQKKAAPVISSIESSQSETEKTNTIIKYVYIEKPASEELEAQNNSDETPVLKPFNKVNNERIVHYSLSGACNQNPEFNTIAPPTVDYGQFAANNEEKKILNNFSIELRNTQYWNSSEADELLTEETEFQNIGAALFWNVNKNLAVGIDVRQEKFFQKFVGRDEFDDLYEYKQYPNFWSVSGALRYNFFSYSAFNVYTQLMLGGVNSGITGRLQLGMEYALTPSTSVMLGAEGSWLHFKYDNAWFDSNKIGVHYGMSFKF